MSTSHVKEGSPTSILPDASMEFLAGSGEIGPVILERDWRLTPLGPMHVLVVDDNVDAAQCFGMLLEWAGHSVWLVSTGATALESIREHRPQVVFLDIGLPDVDGYEVAKLVRGNQPALDISLIAMSGYDQSADQERARSAGFDHYLVKPASFAVTEKLLADISHKRNLAQAIAAQHVSSGIPRPLLSPKAIQGTGAPRAKD